MVGITYYVWPRSLPYITYMEYLAPCTLSQALAPLWLLLLCSLVATHCYFFSSIKKGGEAKSAALHLTPDLLHLYGTPTPRQQTATVSATPGPVNTGPLPHHLQPIVATATPKPTSVTAIPLPPIGQQNITPGQMHNWWGQNQRAFPDTWEEHPPDQSRCFVPKVDPQTPEYREVKTGFLQSIYTQDGPTWKVHNISRVQNTALYDQYSVAKRNMDKGLPNKINERTLWHGTAAGAIVNINENGFNRSYCGKNATFFGEGVYFAVSASYSAQGRYAVPDGNSNRFMYRARVLVGEYTKGDKNMKEPPIKPNSGSHSRYDSVVDNTANPTMFVVFRDAYAYPEYLIEFSTSN
ncbi:hypothetical protein Bbelb_076040 [Branchiostoma belcheri]|nr:hypothetical protein Bbelb_076040 [Branchiostoma belcheri]